MTTTSLRRLIAGSSIALGLSAFGGAAVAQDEGPIRVGILHSLSGTMAISESTLKDEMLMLIEQQNEAGGLLGRQLEPMVMDPNSDWSLYAEQARDMLTGDDRVDVIFGNWTSASRKAVLPVVEELNGLLFYPVQYEGEESSENIFYTGAAPNQQAIPAVDYLMSQGVERWALLGTDYVYPRTTNKILEAYLKDHGVSDDDIMINYTPFGFSDWQSIVSEVSDFGSQGKKTAVVSTINGDANVPFYNELSNQGISASDIPVVAFSVGEQELSGIDTAPLVGHMAAWNYFMSVDSDANYDFIDNWLDFTGNDDAVTNDPMEAHYIGFNMWLQAVESAGTTDVDAVKDAIIGVTVPNLSGGASTMMPNHHITKPVMIGEIQDDGQFSVVWQSPSAVAGDAWSDYLPESANLISDWRAPLRCGKFNVESMTCEDGPGAE
ncbi:urea ABC transporter substrate-binding protein [Salinicola avicenniae]|uniref:urea ABC transporter substrate-binding protein n=1 Tax=Salinicola avicenniae TaxID=2916836 RepID=UPI002073861B|nr:MULTISPECIES: urea ABC transporter substrate-binding protein [unclassified Salinicola]